MVATHDGKFHCDEALACGLLRHTNKFRGCSILRTRNPAPPRFMEDWMSTAARLHVDKPRPRGLGAKQRVAAGAGAVTNPRLNGVHCWWYARGCLFRSGNVSASDAPPPPAPP